MKKIKVIIAMAMISTLVVGSMAGCAKKAAVTPEKTPAAVESTKPVSLALWEQDDPTAQKVLDGLITDFQAANPKHNS